MQHYKKQTHQKNNDITIITCILLAFVSIMFGLSQRAELQRTQYAASNNCTWVYHGSFYLDDRDYTCK